MNVAKAPEDYLPELSKWTEVDFDEHWEAVDQFIADLGPDTALATALRWCRTANDDTRCAGLDVLGNLTRGNPDLLPVLLQQARLAAVSPNEDVRWSAAWPYKTSAMSAPSP